MKFEQVVAVVISAAVLFAAFKYEREDMGCTSCLDSSVTACSDLSSVYVRDCIYDSSDGPPTIKKKLRKLLNHDKSAGSWKRCVLWSFLLTILNFVIYQKGGCIDDTNINSRWLFVISWIVNFSVLYALKSFESFHIFGVINGVGAKLISKL